MYVGKKRKKNMSKLDFRHCSRLSKSRFKNCQVAERRVHILWNSTDRKSYSADFKLGPKLAKFFRVLILHYLV